MIVVDVLAAVEFDDQAGAAASEVCDVLIDLELAGEPWADALQGVPEGAFGIGCVIAEMARAVRGHSVVLLEGRATPNPSTEAWRGVSEDLL